MSRVYDCDGHEAAVTWDNLKPGAVVRRVEADGGLPAFSDCVVLAVGSDNRGETRVRLARPYGYAHGTETTGPTCLMSAELFETLASHMIGKSGWRIVVQATGEPAERKL